MRLSNRRPARCAFAGDGARPTTLDSALNCDSLSADCLGVEMTLNLDRDSAAHAASLARPPYRSAAVLAALAIPNAKPTILLVEDEAGLRGLFRTVLERTGHRVLEARSGIEAVRLWQENGEEVVLSLIDVRIPGAMSGVEFGKYLLTQKPRLPLVYVSGYTFEFAQKDWGLPSDAVFLQKPFRPDRLANVVRNSLANGLAAA